MGASRRHAEPAARARDPYPQRVSENGSSAPCDAERASGLSYVVWVGSTDEDLRVHAERLHAGSGAAADDTVLVAVDPGRRSLEIVTGATARRALDDRSCALAALTMTSCFAGGDLVGGVVQGLASLADHARTPQVLHLDQP